MGNGVSLESTKNEWHPPMLLPDDAKKGPQAKKSPIPAIKDIPVFPAKSFVQENNRHQETMTKEIHRHIEVLQKESNATKTKLVKEKNMGPRTESEYNLRSKELDLKRQQQSIDSVKMERQYELERMKLENQNAGEKKKIGFFDFGLIGMIKNLF